MSHKSIAQPALETFREELLVEAGRLLLEVNEEPEVPYAGFMPDTFEDELAASLSPETRARLADVKQALVRIDEGSFGSCDSCGTEIERAELETHPWADRCARCQRPVISPFRTRKATTPSRARTLAA
jgi:RNA polymerase-binding transcription factor DksA